MHSSILLLLPDPNCSDSAYSHKTKRACGAEHGCYRSQGGERPEGARQGLLPITTQGLFQSSSHLAISVSHGGWWLSFMEMQHFGIQWLVQLCWCQHTECQPWVLVIRCWTVLSS